MTKSKIILGSHLSIAGGIHNALTAAEGYGFQAVAIFVRNQRQWKSSPLTDDAVEQFKNIRRQTEIRYVVAHASYLINLAGDDEIREKSIQALKEDYLRCGRLGIEYLVFHPGSHRELDEGISLIAAGLDRIFSESPKYDTKILLETTAGQGNCIGHRFEHLADIIHRSRHKKRLGVCLDTCHVFTAGYDLRSKTSYRKTMLDFDRAIGLDKLLAIHLNDSKNPLGSRKDRHEHIAEGHIGLEAFGHIVRDRRLRKIPMIMETPKGLDQSQTDSDEVNRDKLYSLLD